MGIGNCSTGNLSTGDWSTGNRSTGNRSTGYWSTGNYSTGDWSTGSHSTGDWSTGYWSTGNYSTGYWSTGNYSTGDWSISDYSTGHFSTIDYSGFGAFNKPCTPMEWDNAEKPNFLFFDLTEWVPSERMTEYEKSNNPEHKITGGYLRVYEYKEAWRRAWNNALDSDKELLYNLPNFDPDVFLEISGIDVRKSKVEEMTLEDVCKELGREVKIVK